MVCSMVKKGVLGAALAAGALYLVFGTSAPSYVRTAFHKVRHNAKAAVPIQFEIDRAREEIDRLEPAIKECLETAVRTEVEVEHLDKEITVVKNNLTQEEKKLLALRDDVKTGKLRLTNGSTAPANEAKMDLARRYDHYLGRQADPGAEGRDRRGQAEDHGIRPPATGHVAGAEGRAADEAARDRGAAQADRGQAADERVQRRR